MKLQEITPRLDEIINLILAARGSYEQSQDENGVFLPANSVLDIAISYLFELDDKICDEMIKASQKSKSKSDRKFCKEVGIKAVN